MVILSDNLNQSPVGQLDDVACFGSRVVVAAIHHVVGLGEHLGLNLSESGRRFLSAYVGGCGDYGFAETSAKFLREALMSDADSGGAVS